MTQTIPFLGDYIDGHFRQSEKADGEFEIKSPGDLSDHIMTLQFKNSHVEEACRVAKKAFLPWATLTLEKRREYLMRLKELYTSNKDLMAEVISRETGKPSWEGQNEVQTMINKIDLTFSFSLQLVADQKVDAALPGIPGSTRYKPRGVMAVIGPFNFPGHLPNGHFIPALALGNTVVFKPSEKTPVIGQLIAEMFHKAGFPPGVFNLVQGKAETGRKLIANEDVDGILFTGSYEVGQKIKQETLDHHWKILALEMGGKNASIVWDDCDFDKAIYENILGAYLTTGQRCSCTSRLLVHKKILNQFMDRFYNVAKKLRIGHWKESVFMGPLISAEAVEKYVRFQEIAKREDCESIMRGKELDVGRKGFYVTPSISLVKQFRKESMFLKTEIFGPNVSIYPVDDFDQALEINNSTGYGLVLSLFTKDRNLYEKAFLQAKVGLLNWNRATNGASSKLPFGGMGKSGNDRPSGNFAVQYCSVPVACLEDPTAFDKAKLFPGVEWG